MYIIIHKCCTCSLFIPIKPYGFQNSNFLMMIKLCRSTKSRFRCWQVEKIICHTKFQIIAKVEHSKMDGCFFLLLSWAWTAWTLLHLKREKKSFINKWLNSNPTHSIIDTERSHFHFQHTIVWIQLFCMFLYVSYVLEAKKLSLIIIVSNQSCFQKKKKNNLNLQMFQSNWTPSHNVDLFIYLKFWIKPIGHALDTKIHSVLMLTRRL